MHTAFRCNIYVSIKNNMEVSVMHTAFRCNIDVSIKNSMEVR